MNELKVGILALFTMASIVYMSLKITSFQSGFGEYVTYRTILKDASGIFPKTPIKIAGITAGKIKKIELHGNNALVTFRILKRIKVTDGSSLIIKSVGFLGDKYLDIKGEDVRPANRIDNPKPLTEYHENHPYMYAEYDKGERG